MSTAVARIKNGAATPVNRVGAWNPFNNDIFGFDPFQHFRVSLGFDYDVTRTENGYEVEVPVPGYRSDQLDVTLNDEVLNITGKNERRTFTRSLMIPEDVDVDSINAEVTNGILRLTLQRHPEAQPKKIAVK